jgi:EAL domain-containing protein (putative c-di-GMP-specific phosphodiesterase class I)/GGDEF domain-containing protein
VGAIGILTLSIIGSPIIIATSLATTAALLGLIWHQERRVKQAVQRIDAANAATTPSASLESGVASIEHQLESIGHRLAQVHPVSGLPVREAMVAHMTADGAGVLGVLAFADLDRLAAFDPALSDRVFASSANRLRRMLRSHYFLAQVDRGHIGIWFGNEAEDAKGELDAIVYALSDVIEVDGQHLIPQIKVRLARFDMSDELDAAVFLTRTLASFSLPSALTLAMERPPADYAELARDRYALEQDLRLAIGRRELRLVFQPLINASNGCVDGAEALLRWNHAERGAIPPARFVPIMEAMGFASEIGLWVLNAAVREARHWAGEGMNGLRVAVNVSGLQLERDDLAIMVQRTLQRHEIGAAALEIELTESIATTDAEHCRRIFQDLRKLGVKLAVDDFGTGYSGFSSLRTLAFDKIKIDREFITDVDKRRDSQAICQSIIALGRGLGIRVLAEGVERREEYEWLRRHGCQHFQGYYFGRPMERDAFDAFVRAPAKLHELLRLDDAAHLQERLRA